MLEDLKEWQLFSYRHHYFVQSQVSRRLEVPDQTSLGDQTECMEYGPDDKEEGHETGWELHPQEDGQWPLGDLDKTWPAGSKKSVRKNLKQNEWHKFFFQFSSFTF